MKIPRAATQKNVNVVAYEMLKPQLEGSKLLLDSPCGEAIFSKFLLSQHPKLRIDGVDMMPGSSSERFEFHRSDILEYLKAQPENKFDCTTCISGVMHFDSVTQVIRQFYRTLKPGGTLVLSNDNISTVRDRFEFLLFGRVKRFNLLFKTEEPIWNLVLIQTLYMLLAQNKFRDVRVRFTAVYVEDFLFFPFALLLYPLLVLKLCVSKADVPLRQRLRLLPFMSLVGRHYVISARK